MSLWAFWGLCTIILVGNDSSVSLKWLGKPIELMNLSLSVLFFIHMNKDSGNFLFFEGGGMHGEGTFWQSGLTGCESLLHFQKSMVFTWTLLKIICWSRILFTVCQISSFFVKSRHIWVNLVTADLQNLVDTEFYLDFHKMCKRFFLNWLNQGPKKRNVSAAKYGFLISSYWFLAASADRK